MTSEAYAPDFVRVNCMVNPHTGEIRFVGGDYEDGPQDSERPLIGQHVITRLTEQVERLESRSNANWKLAVKQKQQADKAEALQQRIERVEGLLRYEMEIDHDFVVEARHNNGRWVKHEDLQQALNAPETA